MGEVLPAVEAEEAGGGEGGGEYGGDDAGAPFGFEGGG